MQEKVLVLKVGGMTCEGCVKNVTNILRSIEGVGRAEVSLEKKRATVWFDGGKANEEKIRGAIRREGYLVGDVDLEAR
jgi:copper chaperone